MKKQCKRYVGFTAISLLALLAVPGASQEQVPQKNCEAAEYRAFDFWLGDWEVFSPQGDKLGENRIARIEGNCALWESWRDSRGGTGQSLNFYDPARKAWIQLWLSSNSIIRLEGVPRNGVLELTGTMTRFSDGVVVPLKGRWTLQDDGSVVQEFLAGDDAGNWKSVFIGIYRRKAS